MEIVLAYDRPEDASRLIGEYTEAILREGKDVQDCLSLQHLDHELEAPGEKYGPPSGRLYLALEDGEAVGCAALARNDDDYCELKRVYVRSAHRGKHISRALVLRAIEDARKIGYQHMRLDTFPFMKAAIRLYESLGFREVERYNDNPAPSAVYLQLDLK